MNHEEVERGRVCLPLHTKLFQLVETNILGTHRGKVLCLLHNLMLWIKVRNKSWLLMMCRYVQEYKNNSNWAGIPRWDYISMVPRWKSLRIYTKVLKAVEQVCLFCITFYLCTLPRTTTWLPKKSPKKRQSSKKLQKTKRFKTSRSIFLDSSQGLVGLKMS